MGSKGIEGLVWDEDDDIVAGLYHSRGDELPRKVDSHGSAQQVSLGYGWFCLDRGTVGDV